MTDLGHICDAESCDLPATQVGVADLPGRRVELRLCDTHVAALRAGKVREISQEQRPHDGGYTSRVSFNA